jgi:hypothetical protein
MAWTDLAVTPWIPIRTLRFKENGMPMAVIRNFLILCVSLPLVLCSAVIAQQTDPLADLDAEISAYIGSGQTIPASYEDPVLDAVDGPSVLEYPMLPIGDGAQAPMESEPVFARSSESWMRRGCWYVHQDVAMMSRSLSNTSIVTVESTSATTFNAVIIPRRPNSYTFEPAMRTTIGRHLGRDLRNRDHAIEFSFFGLAEWNKGFGINARPGSFLLTLLDPAVGRIVIGGPIVGTIAGFNIAESITQLSRSYYNSFEVNFRVHDRLAQDRVVYTPDGKWTRHATPRRNVSFLGGIRYTSFDDYFVFAAHGTDPNTNIPTSGLYTVDTVNDLFGVHAGIELREQHETWSISARCKGGVAVNFTGHDSVIMTTPDDPVEGSASFNEDNLSVYMDASIGGTYQIRPNLVARASFEMAWIQAVALAPDQLSLISGTPTTIDVGGNVFMLGASLGLECNW